MSSDIIVNDGLVVNGEGSGGGGGGPVTDVLNINQGAIVANAPNYIQQEWNNGAVIFTGFKLNIIGTAFDPSSRTFRIQSNGVDVWNIKLDGTIEGGVTIFIGATIISYLQLLNAAQLVFSNGSDFARGLTAIVAGAVDGVKVTNGSTGYSTIQAESAQLNPAATVQPAADAAHRGMIWYTPGGAGVADKLEVCRKDAADAYAWVTLI